MYTEHVDIPQNTDCCSVGPLCDSMTEACQASLSFISSSPEVCTNSCPLSWWCHPTISSSVDPFSSRLNPSRHLGISQWAGSLHQWTKYWGFSFSICPLNEYSRVDFLQDWLAWSPCCPRNSQKSSPAPWFEGINSSALSLLYCPALTSVHDYWRKTIALTIPTFVGKVMSLLFNMLSRLVTAFLPKSKRLWSWLQSPSAVILEPKKTVCHCFHFFPIYLPGSDATRYHDLHFFEC